MEYNERYIAQRIVYNLDDTVQSAIITTSNLSGTIIYLERIIEFIYNDHMGDRITYKVDGVYSIIYMPAGVNTHRRLITRHYSKGRYVKIKLDIENTSRHIKR